MTWRIRWAGAVFGAVVVLSTTVATGTGAGAAPPSPSPERAARAAVCDMKPSVRWEGGRAELTITRCAPDARRTTIDWSPDHYEATLPVAGTRIPFDRIPVNGFTGEYRGGEFTVSAGDPQDAVVGVGTGSSVPPFTDSLVMLDRLGRDLAGHPLTWQEANALGHWESSVALAELLIAAPYWQVQSPIVRLYRAAFLRLPETAGLDYWVGRRRAGTSLAKAAAFFAASPELVARYGHLSDRDFVEQVYENILGRSGEQAGIDYWTQQLQSHRRTRGAVLLGFSESSEHRTRTQDVVDTVNVVSGLLRRVPTSGELATSLLVSTRIDRIFATTEYTSRIGDVPPLPLPLGDASATVVGDVGYRAQLSADFATGAVTYSVPAGSALPPGLTLTSGGLLSGDPTPGTYTFRIAATDASGATGTNQLRITVRPARTGLKLAAGHCVLDLEGDVECTGDDPDVSPATDLASGSGRVCAITGGTIRCWGQYGWSDTSPTPTAIPGITTATQVAVGRFQGCAVLTGGGVQCWTDGAPDARTPAAVVLPHPATQVEVAPDSRPNLPTWGHACALLDDGSVWCWGDNSAGQLGTGGGDWSATPVAVPGVTGAVEVAVDAQGACARLAGGAVWCWGDGNLLESWPTAPAPFDAAAGATDLGAGDAAMCALLAGGTVTCWGWIAEHPTESGTSGYPTFAINPISVLTGVTALDGLGATIAGDRIRTIQPTTSQQQWSDVVTGPAASWIFA